MDKAASIVRYSKIYQADNTSRVFAPLADHYRKSKLLDKAEEVLKNGLKHHPNYLLGRIVYAECLMEMGSFDKAYKLLAPYLVENADNIRLQQLFSEICLQLSNEKEALKALKRLSFLNPKNKDVKEKISALEKYMTLEVIESVPLETPVSSDLMDLEKIAISDAIDWSSVNLYENNQMDLEPINETIKVTESKELPKEVNDTVDNKSKKMIVTPTLIDLYISQGLLSEAKKLIVSELEQKDDPSYRQKLQEIEGMFSNSGSDRLMNIFDAKVKKEQDPKYLKIQEKYILFLEKIRVRALQV